MRLLFIPQILQHLQIHSEESAEICNIKEDTQIVDYRVLKGWLQRGKRESFKKTYLCQCGVILYLKAELTVDSSLPNS